MRHCAGGEERFEAQVKERPPVNAEEGIHRMAFYMRRHTVQGKRRQHCQQHSTNARVSELLPSGWARGRLLDEGDVLQVLHLARAGALLVAHARNPQH